jgi:uncharacterized membrane protein YbhN (UPF0104 family)
MAEELTGERLMTSKRNARWVKWLAIILTVGILLIIYTSIDRSLLLHYLVHVHPGYFALALSLFIPQILVSSLRWKMMTRQLYPMGLWQSVQQVMASKALNAFVPSKLGEMSRAYFLKLSSDSDLDNTIALVILEKILDAGGLCTILIAGILVAPERDNVLWLCTGLAGGYLVILALLLFIPLGGLGERLVNWWVWLKWLGRLLMGWDVLLAGWEKKRGLLSRIVGLSVLIWILHVVQIYLFFPSLNHIVPVAPSLAFIPLSVFVGLLPITIGGMGTRDSALIALFASYAGSTLMAGVGLLCSMRYWVDTLLGIPFLHYYTRRFGEVQGGKS